MARNWINRIAWVGAVTVASLPLMSLAGQTVGINAAVRNEVKVKQTGTSAARDAKRGEQVKLGNLFTTGKSSKVQIDLLDRTSITAGPNAKLTINRFVYDPASKSSSVGASVVKGTFRFLTGKSARGGNNTVDTPSATIGIRGTILEGAVGENALTVASLQPDFVMPARVDRETAAVIVLRGPGPQAPTSEKPGQITVTAGGSVEVLNLPDEAVFIPFAGATPIRFNLGVPAYEPFDVMLRTAPDNFSYAAAALLLGPSETLGNVTPPAGVANPGDPVGTARPPRRPRKGRPIWITLIAVPIGIALITNSKSS